MIHINEHVNVRECVLHRAARSQLTNGECGLPILTSLTRMRRGAAVVTVQSVWFITWEVPEAPMCGAESVLVWLNRAPHASRDSISA